MMGFNLGARAETVVITVRGAVTPRQVVVRSLGLVARAGLEAIALVSVVALLAYTLVPGLRTPVKDAGIALWVALGGHVEAVTEEADDETTDAPQFGQPVVLDAADTYVATYLARRYHVADNAVRMVVAAAHAAGKERRIDPLLILAVVAVESSMNPFAQSPVGATGLMQVMPGLHGAKFGDGNHEVGPLDPVANIRVGSEILSDVIRRGGSVERGLQLYVGAGNQPDDGGYAGRVLSELGRLRLAYTGGVAAALAAAAHADTHSAVFGADPLTSAMPPELSTPQVRRQNPA
jgi:hypothetical protein